MGLDPIKAWDYTPAEVGLFCKQLSEQRKFAIQSMLSLAWHTEAFARQKRLPQLKAILKSVDNDKQVVDKADLILKKMAREKGVIIK